MIPGNYFKGLAEGSSL